MDLHHFTVASDEPFALEFVQQFVPLQTESRVNLNNEQHSGNIQVFEDTTSIKQFHE